MPKYTRAPVIYTEARVLTILAQMNSDNEKRFVDSWLV